jgi:hypothetical protein
MHAASCAHVASSTPTRRLQAQRTPLNGAVELASRPNKSTPSLQSSAMPRAPLRGPADAVGADGRADRVWEDEEGVGELGPTALETLEGVGLPRKQWLWLQRQRVLWRCGRLQGDRVRLLYAAGVASICKLKGKK